VVNAYGNTDEGDVSSGLDRDGPAAAEKVGRRQAGAMLDAWREAGGESERRPRLDRRWTRSCFCGRQTEAGRVDDEAVVGVPFLTGSEENRGPLFDITGVPFEGVRSPVGAGAQGHKLPAVSDAGTGSFPTAVPLSTVRVGDRVIATIPGEMTAEMGRRVRRGVLDASGGGVSRVVLSGLANDFIQYFTTPQEYERQHYEGGSTLFGRAASVFVQERLSDLAERMADGDPAPVPDPFDARNGVQDDAAPYGRGSERAEVLEEPGDTRRLQRAKFGWEGGPRGLDRPLEDPFVSIERRTGSGWEGEATDLGLQILWSVREGEDEDTGRYRARWEAPLDAAPGRYRFVVTANRYRLRSDPFRLRRSHELDPDLVSNESGEARVALDYPRPVPEKDFTHRPRSVDGGEIIFTDEDGDEIVARERRGSTFLVEGRPGTRLEVKRHDASDRHGNRNGDKLSFEL
jgi:neutral ceramidase